MAQAKKFRDPCPPGCIRIRAVSDVRRERSPLEIITAGSEAVVPDNLYYRRLVADGDAVDTTSESVNISTTEE